jgi:3-hydroxyisobutyrate dehydrogenase-like beta-hydroxyacid dehydrogenase
MGFAMASNIRKKMPSESTLYINDINTQTCERFKAEYGSLGTIEIVATAREAAKNSSVLISIVPGGQDVKTVYLDAQNGVIAARKDGERLMLECSTIDVESTKEVGRRLKEAGSGVYIDAPVSVRYDQKIPSRECIKLTLNSRAVFPLLKQVLSRCSSVTQHHRTLHSVFLPSSRCLVHPPSSSSSIPSAPV